MGARAARARPTAGIMRPGHLRFRPDNEPSATRRRQPPRASCRLHGPPEPRCPIPDGGLSKTGLALTKNRSLALRIDRPRENALFVTFAGFFVI